MVDKLLKKIQQYLTEEGMDCAPFEEDGDNLSARLLVYLGADHKNRERIIEITADEQLMPANFKNFAEMQVERGCYRLEIQTPFPASFQSNYAGQMASAINFINGMLELPGLISDEVNDKVLYRTVQLVAEEDYKKTLLVGVVGMHRMVLDMFSGVVEKVGTGELTYLQLLDDILKVTGVMDKKPHA